MTKLVGGPADGQEFNIREGVIRVPVYNPRPAFDRPLGPSFETVTYRQERIAFSNEQKCVSFFVVDGMTPRQAMEKLVDDYGKHKKDFAATLKATADRLGDVRTMSDDQFVKTMISEIIARLLDKREGLLK